MAKRNLFFVVTLIFALGGLYYFGVAASHWYGYLADTTSQARNEYTEGVFLALMISFPFWLLVSGFSFPIRKQLPRGLYLALNAPAALLGAGFVVVNLYVLAMADGKIQPEEMKVIRKKMTMVTPLPKRSGSTALQHCGHVIKPTSVMKSMENSTSM